MLDGDQNHSRAAFPARPAPAKSAPARVFAVNCSTSGPLGLLATADGEADGEVEGEEAEVEEGRDRI
ncbi:hypothetical protein GCM10027610_025860 [Dactylosporangium cerinum]